MVAGDCCRLPLPAVDSRSCAARRRPVLDANNTAAVTGRSFGDEEIHDDLALRRQERAEAPEAGPHQCDVGRDQAVEEVARILAAHLDDAAIGQKRCFPTLQSSFSKFLWG